MEGHGQAKVLFTRSCNVRRAKGDFVPLRSHQNQTIYAEEDGYVQGNVRRIQAGCKVRGLPRVVQGVLGFKLRPRFRPAVHHGIRDDT